MKKVLFFLMAAMAMTLGFVACDDDDDAPSIVGAWKYVPEEDAEDEEEVEDEIEYNTYLIFTKDSITMYYTEADTVFEGEGPAAYVYNNGKIFIYEDSGDEAAIWSAELTKNKLDILMDDDDDVWSLVRVKTPKLIFPNDED